MRTPSKKEPSVWKLVAFATTLGMNLFCCILVGVFIGYYIDQHWNIFPIGILLFSFLGAITGFWTLYKKMMGKE